MKRTIQVWATACVISGLATGLVLADTHTWTNVTAGTFNWSDAANWDAAGLPPSDGTADVVFSNSLSSTAIAYTVTVDAPWGGATGSVNSLTFLSGGNNGGDHNTLKAGSGVDALSIGAGGVKLDTTLSWANRTFEIPLYLAASQGWFIEMNNIDSENRYLAIKNNVASPSGVNWILGGRGKTQFEAGNSTGFLGHVTLNGYVNLAVSNQYGRFGDNPVVVDNSTSLVSASSVAAPKLVFNDLSVGQVTMRNAFVLNLTNSAANFFMRIGQGPSPFAGTGTSLDLTNTWSGRVNSGIFAVDSGFPIWDDRYKFKFSGNNADLLGPTNFSQGSAIRVVRVCAVADGPHAWGINNSLTILAGPQNNRVTGAPTSVLATDGNTVNAAIQIPIANQGMNGNRNPRAPVALGLYGPGTVTFAGPIKVDSVTATNVQSEVHMLRLTAPSNGLARFTGNITETGTYGAPMQILGLGDVALTGTNTGFKSQTLVRSGRLLLGSPLALATNLPVNLGDTVSFPVNGGVRLATTLPLEKISAWSAGTFTFSSAPTVDGLVPSVGDRVLVKCEVAALERNGIFVVNTATSWSRAADLDEAPEFAYGLRVKVSEGAVNAGRAFFLFNQEDIAYSPLVMNSSSPGSYAYFGFNDEPSPNPDVALLATAAITVSNNVVVSDNLSSGASVLGGSTAEASIFTGDMTLNRDVQVTAAAEGTVTFSGALTGAGSVIKTGAGTVVLAGTRAYTGITEVRAGTLSVPGDVTITNTLAVAVAADGSATFAVGGNLTLGTGSVLTVSAESVFNPSLKYTLLTYTGALTGTFGTVSGLPPKWHLSYAPGRVKLYYGSIGSVICIL